MSVLRTATFLAPVALCLACGDDAASRSDASVPRDARTGLDASLDCPLVCADGIDCTEDSCGTGNCVHQPNGALCPAGSSCDPRMGCTAGRPCAADPDCGDEDPCTTNERCDRSTRVCVFEILDGDGDGFGPPVCGGADCDDNNAGLRPGGPESCNGLDDNCNDVVDEDTGMVCGEGESCVRGECVCALGFLDCGECANVRSDPRNCGACSVRCGSGNDCVEGVCRCQPSEDLCDTGCSDLRTDALNCGACGSSCPDGVSCRGGVCACPAGGTACGPNCVDLATSRMHCGGCGVTCREEPPEECVSGACQSCGGAGMPCCPATPRCHAGICGGDGLCTSCPTAGGTGAPCCYRVEDPDPSFLEFRIVGLLPGTPSAFANAAISGLLQGGIDENLLNILFILDSRAAPIAQIGPGEVSAGVAVMFRMLDAASLEAVAAGTRWSASASTRPLQFDLRATDGSTTLSLPLDLIELPDVEVSEEGRCVGARAFGPWLSGGTVQARILLGRARAAPIPPLGINLCELIAGGACEGSPATWSTPPDHIDPVLDDSYWVFRARFAAASTEIEALP